MIYLDNAATSLWKPEQVAFQIMQALQTLGNQGQKNNGATQNNTDDSTVGRPEKPDDQKSDTTIANQESLS